MLEFCISDGEEEPQQSDGLRECYDETEESMPQDKECEEHNESEHEREEEDESRKPKYFSTPHPLAKRFMSHESHSLGTEEHTRGAGSVQHTYTSEGCPKIKAVGNGKLPNKAARDVQPRQKRGLTPEPNRDWAAQLIEVEQKQNKRRKA